MEKKTVEMALLLDVYGQLLTDKQREVLELYYNEDLSLAEIAQLGSITRQGVRDAIVRGENTLLETEQKTGLLARLQQIQDCAAQLETCIRQVEASSAQDSLSPVFTEIYALLYSLQQ